MYDANRRPGAMPGQHVEDVSERLTTQLVASCCIGNLAILFRSGGTPPTLEKSTHYIFEIDTDHFSGGIAQIHTNSRAADEQAPIPLAAKNTHHPHQPYIAPPYIPPHSKLFEMKATRSINSAEYRPVSLHRKIDSAFQKQHIGCVASAQHKMPPPNRTHVHEIVCVPFIFCISPPPLQSCFVSSHNMRITLKPSMYMGEESRPKYIQHTNAAKRRNALPMPPASPPILSGIRAKYAPALR